VQLRGARLGGAAQAVLGHRVVDHGRAADGGAGDGRPDDRLERALDALGRQVRERTCQVEQELRALELAARSYALAGVAPPAALREPNHLAHFNLRCPCISSVLSAARAYGFTGGNDWLTRNLRTQS